LQDPVDTHTTNISLTDYIDVYVTKVSYID